MGYILRNYVSVSLGMKQPQVIPYITNHAKVT